MNMGKLSIDSDYKYVMFAVTYVSQLRYMHALSDASKHGSVVQPSYEMFGWESWQALCVCFLTESVPV